MSGYFTNGKLNFDKVINEIEVYKIEKAINEEKKLFDKTFVNDKAKQTTKTRKL